MGDTFIKDPVTGQRARVDGGRVQTQSVSQSTISEVSFEQGNAFTAFMDDRTASAGVEHPLFYFRFTDTTPGRHFHVENFFSSFNGGNTTGDGSCTIRVYFNAPTPPSANHVSFTPVNMNLASAGNLNASCFVWDGVGAGMTMAGNGTKAFSRQLARSSEATGFPVAGSVVAFFNTSILITATPSETGIVSCGMYGWSELPSV